MIPIRNTFNSNGIANSRARLNKKSIRKNGSSLKRVYLIGVTKYVMETLRRNVVQGIMNKKTVLQNDMISKFKNLEIANIGGYQHRGPKK